jgi:hypothetical protein
MLPLNLSLLSVLRAPVLELKGQTPITSVSGVIIDWDRLLANLVWTSSAPVPSNRPFSAA